MYTVKQWMIFCVVCVLMLCTLTVSAEEATLSVSSSAASTILYEPSSGRVLYEKNAHIKRPMASTTKLMTALVAVRSLDEDAVLTASAQALDVIGSSLGLRVGDTVTRDDLLKGLLLSSGNDAANVIALSVADSFEAFAQKMNALAAEIGMTNTQFVTPSGLDADGHGSTAYDMALLCKEVLKNECLASICRMKTATVTLGGRTVTISNHNRLLSMYPHAIGMKTGYTSQSGRCLVSAAEKDGVTLIAVTLDCANDWNEHITLYEEGFSLLEIVLLTVPTLPTLRVFGGDPAALPLAAGSVPSVTLMNGDAAMVETRVVVPPFAWAPIAKGESVGRIEYCLRGEVIAAVPIVSAEESALLTEQSWLWKTGRLFWLLLCEAVT